MKHLILPALLLLAACAPATDRAQSYAALTAESLYISASNTGEALVIAEQMDKTRFKELDRQAYAVLLAYRAGNATIDQLKAALKPLEGK